MSKRDAAYHPGAGPEVFDRNEILASASVEEIMQGVETHAESFERRLDALQEDDPVNYPSHYTSYKGIEVIQLTEQMNFNRGNAVKYVARAGLKGGPLSELEDLQKAAWYLAREIERVKEQHGQ